MCSSPSSWSGGLNLDRYFRQGIHVGAGAGVTKVPSNCIVGCNPARIIREDVTLEDLRL